MLGANKVFAVGISFSDSGETTLIEHWNGTKLTAVPAATPSKGRAIELIGASCVAPTVAGRRDLVLDRARRVGSGPRHRALERENMVGHRSCKPRRQRFGRADERRLRGSDEVPHGRLRHDVGQRHPAGEGAGRALERHELEPVATPPPPAHLTELTGIWCRAGTAGKLSAARRARQ